MIDSQSASFPPSPCVPFLEPSPPAPEIIFPLLAQFRLPGSTPRTVGRAAARTAHVTWAERCTKTSGGLTSRGVIGWRDVGGHSEIPRPQPTCLPHRMCDVSRQARIGGEAGGWLTWEVQYRLLGEKIPASCPASHSVAAA